MFIQILIGSVTILVTMAVMVGFVGTTIRFYSGLEKYDKNDRRWNRRLFLSLSAAVLMVLCANTICIWIWALLFSFLQIFPDFNTAVYFSLVSFTTVGYGDVVAGEEWRILTAFVAVNGLLAFGIFTAFLIQVVGEVSERP